MSQEENVELKPSMDLHGLLTLLYVGGNILGILLSNRLFAGFVAAKPEGRKTAIADKWTRSRSSTQATEPMRINP